MYNGHQVVYKTTGSLTGFKLIFIQSNLSGIASSQCQLFRIQTKNVARLRRLVNTTVFAEKRGSFENLVGCKLALSLVASQLCCVTSVALNGTEFTYWTCTHCTKSKWIPSLRLWACTCIIDRIGND